MLPSHPRVHLHGIVDACERYNNGPRMYGCVAHDRMYMYALAAHLFLSHSFWRFFTRVQVILSRGDPTELASV